MLVSCRGGCCEWCYYLLSFSSPPPRGVNEGQLIGDLCGPLRRWRWLPWLQARAASCASINGGMCCGVGGGVTAFRGFPAAAAGPQDRGRTSGAAGWAVTVSSLTGAAEAQLELGVASPPRWDRCVF